MTQGTVPAMTIVALLFWNSCIAPGESLAPGSDQWKRVAASLPDGEPPVQCGSLMAWPHDTP